VPFSGEEDVGDGRMERAEEEIHDMEAAADRESLAREAIRARGGGGLRRALARVWPSLRPASPDDDS